MAVSISLSITQNSQNLTNNTSNVTVKTTAKWTYGSWNATGKCTGSMTIDGTKYNFSGITFNTSQTTSGSKVIMTKTVDIPHNADGTKTLACSASFNTRVSSGTVSASASKTLTTIARASQPSCITFPNNTQNVGDIGSTFTIHTNRNSDKFTHYVYCKWGNKTVEIGTNVTNNVSWTIPMNFIEDIPSATSGFGTIYVDTYNGSTKIGTKSVRFDASVPASVKPSCVISVTDAAGHFSTYGKYVKGKSKLNVTITPTLAYGSAIASYSASANGVNYSVANFTTDVLTSSGTLNVSATVTDQRGRSGSANTSINVYDYTAPQITLLKVKRCVSLTDGTEDISGEFAEVTFSAKTTSLDNKNTAKYTLKYKKSTEGDDKYISVVLTDYANNYNVQNGVYRFAADSGSSYNIQLVATDNFEAISKPTPLSTGEVMEHWRADGKGMGFGKIGEVENGADFGWAIKANKGFIPIPIAEGTDFNDIKTPNTYILNDVSNSRYINCPFSSGSGTLKVEACGTNGQLHQTAIFCHKEYPTIFERYYYTDSWGNWLSVDNIVEQGTVSGWNYRKWSSGVIEAWHSPTISVATTTAYGSGYYNGSVLRMVFPSGMFKNKPNITMSAYPANAQLYAVNIAAITNNDISYYISSMQSNTETSMLLNVSAYGFWK